MDLLTIDHLSVWIGDRPILSNVTLNVVAGEIVGLLGPNGAGKSTTIAAALGLIPRRAGSVNVLGTDPDRARSSVYRDLGILPEQNGFYDWMSGDEYLAFFASLRGEEVTPAETASWLATVGLGPTKGQRIGTYSRGMRQRLGLARALIGDPQLLILDEPTNGLDPRGRHEVHELLRALAARGTGILMCTHLLDDVERLCRRVAVIAEGRTLVEGPIAELAGAAAHPDRYRLRLSAAPPNAGAVEGLRQVKSDGETWVVDLDPGAVADAVWRNLICAGWRVEEIRSEGRGLESLYLSLTDLPKRKAA
ncbi:MAG: ABC transporter ATP-binding protein [Rhodobacteraceae bacterium]|nr:ABC transporter ATP-binding protein [Paracoccaceae bacterium]